MIRAQILFPPEMYDKIKAEAQLQNTSISNVVRKSINKTIIKKQKNGREILLAMAKEAGTSDTAPKDLGANDDYLYKLP